MRRKFCPFCRCFLRVTSARRQVIVYCPGLSCRYEVRKIKGLVKYE